MKIILRIKITMKNCIRFHVRFSSGIESRCRTALGCRKSVGATRCKSMFLEGLASMKWKHFFRTALGAEETERTIGCIR